MRETKRSRSRNYFTYPSVLESEGNSEHETASVVLQVGLKCGGGRASRAARPELQVVLRGFAPTVPPLLLYPHLSADYNHVCQSATIDPEPETRHRVEQKQMYSTYCDSFYLGSYGLFDNYDMS